VGGNGLRHARRLGVALAAAAAAARSSSRAAVAAGTCPGIEM